MGLFQGPGAPVATSDLSSLDLSSVAFALLLGESEAGGEKKTTRLGIGFIGGWGCLMLEHKV